MPILDNIRHEAFAQSRAGGARLEDAYEDAGFAAGNNHAGRLAQTPEVAQRIAELRIDFRAANSSIEESSPLALIAAMLRVAKAGEGLADAAALKEARLTLLQVERLRGMMDASRQGERALMLHNLSKEKTSY